MNWGESYEAMREALENWEFLPSENMIGRGTALIDPEEFVTWEDREWLRELGVRW